MAAVEESGSGPDYVSRLLIGHHQRKKKVATEFTAICVTERETKMEGKLSLWLLLVAVFLSLVFLCRCS